MRELLDDMFVVFALIFDVLLAMPLLLVVIFDVLLAMLPVFVLICVNCVFNAASRSAELIVPSVITQVASWLLFASIIQSAELASLPDRHRIANKCSASVALKKYFDLNIRNAPKFFQFLMCIKNQHV